MGVVAALLLVGCGGDPPTADDVDWSNYSDEWGASVREAAETGNCDRMFRAWEAAMGADDDTLEDFLDDAMERADCPGW